MSGLDGRKRNRARVLRGLIMGLYSASILPPSEASARPPAVDAGPDLKAVETAFTAGIEQFNHGEFTAAARTWAAAAALLPETAEHRANRTALYEKIAVAFDREFDRVGEEPDTQEVAARDALSVLDAYANSHTAAYPGEPLPSSVESVRETARNLVATADARRDAVKPPPKPLPTLESRSPPPTKPWRPLAIGGGFALVGGVTMLAMFGVGFSRAKKFEGQFDDPDNACYLSDPQNTCADIDRQGKANNSLAIAGLVTAPLFIGAGVTLLVLAARRKSAANRKLAPAWSTTMVGLVFEQRF